MEIPVRTKKYAKRWRVYIKTPDGWSGQNDGSGKKGNAPFHFPSPSDHDRCNGHRTQRQYPVDRKHGESERPRASGMFNCGKYCAGFDFRCDRPVLSIVGKLVPGRYLEGCRGEIGWSGVTDCKRGDRYGLVCSLLDDENERHEIVPIKWVVILISSFYPVFCVEGN